MRTTGGIDRRRLLGAGVAGAALAPGLAFAAARDALAGARYRLQPREVVAGIWLVEGERADFSVANGGNMVNCVFMTTGEGVIVFDTGATRLYGLELHAVIEAVTLEPVIEVWISHGHPDHFLGSQAFPGARLRALSGTVTMMREVGADLTENMYRLIDHWMRGTEMVVPAPDLAPGSYTVGRRRLQVMAMAGHTAEDLVVLDESTGTLLSGDLVFMDRAPATPHADLAAWQASLDRLEALGADQLVPGHGPYTFGATAISQTRDYLGWLDETFSRAAEAGLAAAEVALTPMPEAFGRIAVLPGEFVRSVSHLYAGYELAAMARIDGG